MKISDNFLPRCFAWMQLVLWVMITLLMATMLLVHLFRGTLHPIVGIPFGVMTVVFAGLTKGLVKELKEEYQPAEVEE